MAPKVNSRNVKKDNKKENLTVVINNAPDKKIAPKRQAPSRRARNPRPSPQRATPSVLNIPEERMTMASAVEEIYARLQLAILKPDTMVGFVVALIFTVSYLTAAPGLDIMTTFALNLKTSNPEMFLWVTKNLVKAIGAVWYGAALLAVKDSIKTWIVGLAFFWLFFFPEGSIYEPIVQALGLMIFFTTKHLKTRLVVVCIVGSFYTLNYHKINKGLGTKTNSTL